MTATLLIIALSLFCAVKGVRARLHADAYRKWFFGGLIGLGAYSLIRALLQLGL